MTVSPAEKDAMARILMMMEGKTPPQQNASSVGASQLELAGPGQVTSADITAMADVLKKLNEVTDQTVDDMIVESNHNREIKTALVTSKNDQGVKVGLYQIMIKEDHKRLAGKQYYSIYNTRTGDVIADDLSLYETALNVVKLMNNGHYANSSHVRKLFEHDDSYTSHKIDALRYKRGMMVCEKRGDARKSQVYETRLQVSMDKAMAAKKEIKTFQL